MKKIKTLVTIALAILLTISALIAIAPTPNTIEAQDEYGDLLQYEWTHTAGNSASTHFSAGPGPASPDILWKFEVPGRAGTVRAFNGMMFIGRGGVTALDAFTGEIIWQTTDFSGSPTKIDDTYMLVGARVIETATGNVIQTLTLAPGGRGGGTYIPEEKILIQGSSCYSLPDPTQPAILLWERSDIGSHGGLGTIYGDGRLYGSGLGHEMAVNATTGETIWDTPLQGTTGYIGQFYMGRWFKASLDGKFYCLDAETGEILWIYNPGTFWNYWGSDMAAGYGKVYMYNYDSHLYAIDVETGEMVWKYKGPGHYYTTWPTVAGGMVYMCTGSWDYRDPTTGEPGREEYVCVDAETGKLIWKLPIDMNLGAGWGGTGIVAYGNMYLAAGGVNEYWCIGREPKDWPMFLSDPAHTAEGGGPEELALKWKYQTDGIVISSPSIVDGVAYVGSHDKNIYALDADTGTKIWSFETDYYIKSSPAVVDGRVITGADDGNVYGLDATTGTQLWKTFAGGITDLASVANIRSSPTIVGGRAYVGSLDGKLYCLSTNSGNVIWKFDTGGILTSTAAVVDNEIYIPTAAPANGILYKLDATDASVIWQLDIPYDARPANQMPASPTVVDGVVYTPSNGKTCMAINATNAEIIWSYRWPEYDQAGSMAAHGSMLYADGKVYFSDFFGLSCVKNLEYLAFTRSNVFANLCCWQNLYWYG